MRKRSNTVVSAAEESGDPLSGLVVEFVRSVRRRRTISARLEGNRLIVQVPAGLSAVRGARLGREAGERILATRRRRELNQDGDLAERAQQLNERYFEGQADVRRRPLRDQPAAPLGSCTPSQGTIRISDRVAKLPPWVRDAVLVHELAHLVEANHSRRFWRLANRYPLMERARGYLMALGLDDERLASQESGGCGGGELRVRPECRGPGHLAGLATSRTRSDDMTREPRTRRRRGWRRPRRPGRR